MDINDFLPKQQEPISIIQEDGAKYGEITAKLCEKRKNLEEKLKDTSLLPEVREEYALDLLQLRESMRIFGTSEIDYLAYIAKKEKDGGIQLELF